MADLLPYPEPDLAIAAALGVLNPSLAAEEAGLPGPAAADHRDVEAGAHSVRELQFLRVVRAGRLPLPEQQVVRRHAGGRHYLDACWRRYSLHAEIDGLGHLLVATWASDLDRTNELALSAPAQTRLRIAGFWLDERPDHVVELVRRGLLKGGWRPGDLGDVAIIPAA